MVGDKSTGTCSLSDVLQAEGSNLHKSGDYSALSNAHPVGLHLREHVKAHISPIFINDHDNLK